MAKNLMRPVHPGEVLREEYLLPLGMSANALAMALRVPAPRINDIVLERRAVTPDTALRLSRYFGGEAEGWMNLKLPTISSGQVWRRAKGFAMKSSPGLLDIPCTRITGALRRVACAAASQH